MLEVETPMLLPTEHDNCMRVLRMKQPRHAPVSTHIMQARMTASPELNQADPAACSVA